MGRDPSHQPDEAWNNVELVYFLIAFDTDFYFFSQTIRSRRKPEAGVVAGEISLSSPSNGHIFTTEINL